MRFKNIVIVGGGYAGIKAAKCLEKSLAKLQTPSSDKYRILLIEKKSHFYHVLAGVRAGVQDIDNDVLIPYTNLFVDPKNKVLQAGAKHLEEKELLLDTTVSLDGMLVDTIDFEYMIIATGSRYPAPAKLPQTTIDKCQQHLQTLRKQIEEAKHVLIIGGGPVGVELIGEIRDVHHDKKLTLVHHTEFLGDSCLHPKARERLMSLMKKANVTIYLKDYVPMVERFESSEGVVLMPTSAITTENGKEIDCDLVLLAFGIRPNRTWLDNRHHLLADNGFVKVTRTLQVDHELYKHVFVAGDAANLNETKMALRAEQHAIIVAENVKRLVAGQTHLKEYTKGRDMMLISFGKNEGIGSVPCLPRFFSDLLAKMYKSRALLLDRQWKELNLLPPTMTPTAVTTV